MTSQARINVQTRRVKVAIVGGGFGGLCMAIKLREAGIDDFLLLEKGDDVGGTWNHNSYPGAACDVQSHMYSFPLRAIRTGVTATAASRRSTATSMGSLKSTASASSPVSMRK